MGTTDEGVSADPTWRLRTCQRKEITCSKAVTAEVGDAGEFGYEADRTRPEGGARLDGAAGEGGAEASGERVAGPVGPSEFGGLGGGPSVLFCVAPFWLWEARTGPSGTSRFPWLLANAAIPSGARVGSAGCPLREVSACPSLSSSLGRRALDCSKGSAESDCCHSCTARTGDSQRVTGWSGPLLCRWSLSSHSDEAAAWKFSQCYKQPLTRSQNLLSRRGSS